MALQTFTPPQAPSVGYAKPFQSGVEIIDMGHGYEQVIDYGFNSERRQPSVAWTRIALSDAQAIETFFLSVGYATAFKYTLPDEVVERTWRIEPNSFRMVAIDGLIFTVEMQLREVFDQ